MDFNKFKAKAEEVEFMGDKVKLYPLKTRELAHLGELQAKEKYAEASFFLIKKSLNRAIEKENLEKEEKDKISLLTDDDLDEFDPKVLNELVPKLMKVNGLSVDKKKQNEQNQETPKS